MATVTTLMPCPIINPSVWWHHVRRNHVARWVHESGSCKERRLVFSITAQPGNRSWVLASCEPYLKSDPILHGCYRESVIVATYCYSFESFSSSGMVTWNLIWFFTGLPESVVTVRYLILWWFDALYSMPSTCPIGWFGGKKGMLLEKYFGYGVEIHPE